ncbi:hypothetical protein KCP74_12580 [Salmonella enterica subsp. enterica]|nr:hypothetical protein KCP74_12580 [Salmonella enterica subsp. enterica]
MPERASKAGKAESEGCQRQYRYGRQLLPVPVRRRHSGWGGGQQALPLAVMASYISADTDSTGNVARTLAVRTSSSSAWSDCNMASMPQFADAQTHIAARMSTAGTNMVFYNSNVEAVMRDLQQIL